MSYKDIKSFGLNKLVTNSSDVIRLGDFIFISSFYTPEEVSGFKNKAIYCLDKINEILEFYGLNNSYIVKLGVQIDNSNIELLNEILKDYFKNEYPVINVLALSNKDLDIVLDCVASDTRDLNQMLSEFGNELSDFEGCIDCE